MSRTRMPALFLGHGSPMNVLEDNVYTRVWRQLGETLPRPKAIVVVSAHWFTRGTGVTAMEAPKTIHDFGGQGVVERNGLVGIPRQELCA